MNYRVFFVLVLLPFFVFACSNGNDFIAPNPQNQNVTEDITVNESIGVMVDDFTENQTPLSGAGILGLFQGYINPNSLTGELTPLRDAAIDDTLEMVDITNFLTMAPCGDCAKIIGIEIDNEEHVILKIGVRHPFGIGEPLKPITGRNRGDLHVFNVEGTVIIDDSASATPFPGLDDIIAPQHLLNADGYSPYLDIALDEIFNTNATVHPYILHFDDYTVGSFDPLNPMGFASVTDPPPSGNLVMAMGSDYDIKNYVFDIPLDDSYEFLFAIGCTYAVSTTSMSQRFAPEFQIPQHNKKAASAVSVDIASNNLFAGNSESSAELIIKVLDMNHGVAVGDGLDEMKADSSVSAIQVEIPGVTSGYVSGIATPSGGNGRDIADPLTFPVTVYNDLEAGDGSFPGLVKVVDAYQPGLNESSLLSGMDAISRVDPLVIPLQGLYVLDEFATYMTFNIHIGLGNTPPVAVINPDEFLNLCDGATVTFDASASTDLEDDNASPAIPLNFEFDFDYDGVDFFSDTGAPTTDPIAISPPYFQPGPYTAALRVTDSGGLTDIATAEIDFSTEVHEYVETYNITGITYLQSCFNGDVNFIEAGPNAGKILFCYDRGRFALIDPEAGDQEAVPFNSDAGEWGGNFHYIIESCPMTGRVFTPIHAKGNIYAPDGEFLELWEDVDSARFAAVEIADNGDMWAVMQTGSELRLRHYTYSENSPYYEIPAVHDTDLTPDFPPDDRWVCIDLVMDFEQKKIFTFMGRWAPDWDYSIVAYDVSSGNAVKLVERKDVFTKQIIVQVGGVEPFDYGRKADISIDHSLDEQCRILVGGITWYDTDGYHYELVRLDDELNTIDFYDTMPYGTTDDEMPNTFVIASTGTHPIIALPQDYGSFMYFETDNW